MARRARTVFPDIAHHVTQRGNYRMEVFFDDTDRRQYLRWIWEYATESHLEIWGYCLMNNHVHLIAVPRRDDSLGRALGLAHMRYSQYLNRKLGRPGHLWQGRFFSCALDEQYLIRAMRYVERNPVRAGLVERAGDWGWSSAKVHLNGKRLQGAAWPGDDMLADWAGLLEEPESELDLDKIRKQTYTGRPLGNEKFVSKLEELSGKVLRALPRGRPRKREE